MNFSNHIRYIWIALCMISVFQSNAQIAVTNNPPFDNAEHLVENVLLGQGVVAET